MELYVPKFQLKEILEVLVGEGVTFEVTDKTFSHVVEGKEQYEVTEVKANLLEIEVPAIYDEDSLRSFPATFRQKNPPYGCRWQFCSPRGTSSWMGKVSPQGMDLA